MLSEKEKKFLLGLARETLKDYLCKEEIKKPHGLSKIMEERRGGFVSLHEGKELRGCIGSLSPDEPLYTGVMKNAINAAVRDPRFRPVKLEDLDKLDVEISVLSEPKELHFGSVKELMERLHPKKEGVIISKWQYSATFLPQVWEHFFSKEEFLTSLCLKAGLPPDAWKDKELKVYTYQAEVFRESEFK